MEWKGWPVPSYRSVELCAIINLGRFTLWSIIEQKDHALISRLFVHAGRFLAGSHPSYRSLSFWAMLSSSKGSTLYWGDYSFVSVLRFSKIRACFYSYDRQKNRCFTWSSRRLLFNGPLSQVRTKMRSSCFWRPAATISASKLRRRTKRPTERWAQTPGTESCRQPAVKLTDARRPWQPLCPFVIAVILQDGPGTRIYFRDCPSRRSNPVLCWCFSCLESVCGPQLIL